MAVRPSKRRKNAPVDHAGWHSRNVATEHCGRDTQTPYVSIPRPSRKRNSEHIEVDAGPCDAATEHIAAGACDTATEQLPIKIAGVAIDQRRSGLELRMLVKLKSEIEHAKCTPVTLIAMEEDGLDPKMVQKKAWVSTMEILARCIASYHNACVARQPRTCKDCVDSLRRNVGAMLSKIERECERVTAIGLIHEFIENLSTAMAVRQILDASLGAKGIWNRISEQDRLSCLDTLDKINKHTKGYDEALRRYMYILYEVPMK